MMFGIENRVGNDSISKKMDVEGEDGLLGDVDHRGLVLGSFPIENC